VDRLDDFRAFLAVVDKGSLTGAARHLGRSLQSVSRALAALEQDVGVELVRRTTRRSAPTEAGLAFYGRITAALAEITEAKLEAGGRRAEPSGRLRLTASSAFAPLYVVPAVADFLAKYPNVEVELEVSDRYVDLITEGIDLAVRIGALPDSSLKARRLADLRRVCFAAPKYLARHGRPKRPEELARHQCIVRTAALEGDAWPFSIDSGLRTVRVAGRFRASGAAAANEAAVSGLGIANAPLWQVRDLVDRGSVELILTRFEPPPIPVHAVWAETRLPAAKVKAFVDLLAARMKRERL
jgi:DNA-binding transcriptional LysR family regulator